MDQICGKLSNKNGTFDNIKIHNFFEDVFEWRIKVSKHTLVGARHTMLRMMVMAYMGVKQKDNLTEDDIELVHVVGWLLELVKKHIFCSSWYRRLIKNFKELFVINVNLLKDL